MATTLSANRSASVMHDAHRRYRHLGYRRAQTAKRPPRRGRKRNTAAISGRGPRGIAELLKYRDYFDIADNKNRLEPPVGVEPATC
jgi:hypothetical protein